MSRSILVVDDDQATVSLLVEVLEDEGFSCVAATSASEAVAAIDGALPDLVLSDWDLGEKLSGIDVADHLRAVAPSSHLVMMTGRNMKQLIEQMTDHDVFAYLEKPFSVKELLAVVERVR